MKTITVTDKQAAAAAEVIHLAAVAASREGKVIEGSSYDLALAVGDALQDAPSEGE